MHLPIESLNLLMLNVGYAEHNADWNWKEVSSPFIRIFYVKDGSATTHMPNSDIHLKKGCMYIVPPYITHTYECKEKLNLYYLHVYEGFKKDTNIFEQYEFPLEVEGTEEDEKLFLQMCQQHPETKLPASDPSMYDNYNTLNDYVKRYSTIPLFEKMWIRGCTLILFSRFMKHATPQPWTNNLHIMKAIKYIQTNIYSSFSIEEVADAACITKSYLARLFKRHFNISPLQYINQKKIDKAQLLLLTDNINIKEIAYNLSFNDHSYFIRLFKKYTGMTPQEYRQLYKGHHNI